MINSIPQKNSVSPNNSISFKAKIKFVPLERYLIDSMDAVNATSSDIFRPNIVQLPQVKSNGAGPCVAVHLNGEKSAMVHLRDSRPIKEEIISLIEKMGGNENIENCLIFGGDRTQTKLLYTTLLEVAGTKFKNLKNKITALCGQEDLGCYTNGFFDKKTNTYLLNASSVDHESFSESLIKSDKDLNDFYAFRHIAPQDEISYES